MPAPRPARIRGAFAFGAAGLLLAACASHGAAGEPTWRPKPSFSGEGNEPGQRQPVQPTNPAPGPGSSTSSKSPGPSADPSVVATKLTAPTGIAIMPDNSALVAERTTGRIVRVRPEPNQPVQTVRTIPGISTFGGGGLLDLAISPNYAQDRLIFAYLTTARDNRVVDFTLKGPITTVLTGIPRGVSDNTGRLSFARDGSLLVGTGDAGRPSSAADPKTLAGKVLRISDIGAPAAGNPSPRSRVYASGFGRTDGLCADPATADVFQTESMIGSRSDPINELTAGGSYGWPRPTSTTIQAIALLPDASRAPGGCAVLDHVLYTTTLDGKALLATELRTGGGSKLGAFRVSLRNKYGRLRTVVAAADGALWLTTSNRDGNGTPVTDDERVLRIVPGGGGAPNPV